MLNSREIEYHVSPMKELYIKIIMSNKLQKQEDLENQDLTEEFNNHFKGTFKQGHLNVIGIGGEVTMGKSTIGITLMIKGCKYIEKLKLNKFWYSVEEYEKEFIKKIKKDYSKKKIKKFLENKDLIWIKKYTLNKELREIETEEGDEKLNEIYNKIRDSKIRISQLIASDLIEGNRIDLSIGKHVVRMNDEAGEVSTNTGANTFVERGTFTDEIDMSAQKFRHKILITPRGGSAYASSTPIKLETYSLDKKKMITTCVLSYDNVYGAERRTIPLGMVHFEVKDLIENWIKNVKPVFQNNNEDLTLEEWKTIRKWAKKDVYVQYHMKKHARLDLTEYYGKNGVKELEDSEITLMIYNEMKKLCKGFNDVKSGVIKVYISKVLSENKLRWSMIGKSEVDNKIGAYLSLLNEIEKHKFILKTGKMSSKRILTPPERENLVDSLEAEEKGLKEVLQMEQENVNILNRYRSLD